MQSTHTPDIQKTLEDAGVALRFYAKWMRENPPKGDDGHSHRYPFGEDTERNVRAALAAAPAMYEALERIANHEYRTDRKHRGMIDISEIQTLERIARVALAAARGEVQV